MPLHELNNFMYLCGVITNNEQIHITEEESHMNLNKSLINLTRSKDQTIGRLFSHQQRRRAERRGCLFRRQFTHTALYDYHLLSRTQFRERVQKYHLVDYL
jgi:hypothetical protein